MIKTLGTFFILFTIFSCQWGKSLRKPSSFEQTRIVGYLTDWSAVKKSYLEERKLTHVIYSFAIPLFNQQTEEIQFDLPRRLLRNDTHFTKGFSNLNKTKALIAIGGYQNRGKLIAPTFERIVDSDGGIERLVNKTLSLCEKHNLDGVDVDWEFPREAYKDKFLQLISTFREEMNSRQKCNTLSVAVPTRVEDVSGFGNQWFHLVDFVNLMAYDYNKEVHHSSLNHSYEALDLWVNKMGLPPGKAVLGVPFYSKPKVLKYSKIIQMNPLNRFSDQSGQKIYYNGEETIKEKAELAKRYGGIMIWELGQDSLEYPLIKVIEDAMVNHKSTL